MKHSHSLVLIEVTNWQKLLHQTAEQCWYSNDSIQAACLPFQQCPFELLPVTSTMTMPHSIVSILYHKNIYASQDHLKRHIPEVIKAIIFKSYWINSFRLQRCFYYHFHYACEDWIEGCTCYTHRGTISVWGNICLFPTCQLARMSFLNRIVSQFNKG